MQRRHDRRRAELRTVGQHHARDLAAAGFDPDDRRLGADLGAERAGRGRHRRRHAAHAAAREAPAGGLAAGLVEVVVQRDEAGAGAARARPGADHAGDAEQPAHRVGVEALLDEVGDARGEQAGEVERRAHVHLAQLGRERGLLGQRLGSLGPELGRDLMQQRADERAETGEPLLPTLVGVGVARGELADLGAARLRVVGEQQMAAVGARREVGALRVDVVAVLGETQVAHHRLGEQAHDVRQAGDGEVGPEGLLGDRGAADGVPALQHQHAAAGAGKVTGGDEAVVAAADDDHVVRVRHRLILTDQSVRRYPVRRGC
jgi:hypothetical protein